MVKIELGAGKHQAGLEVANGGERTERALEFRLAPRAGHAGHAQHNVLSSNEPPFHIDRSAEKTKVAVSMRLAASVVGFPGVPKRGSWAEFLGHFRVGPAHATGPALPPEALGAAVEEAHRR